MRCRRQCFGWPIVFLAAAAIGSPLVQPGSRVALYDGGSTEDLSSTAVPQLHAVDTPAPELADGCTFSVDFVPAESDLNGTCLLMEIGALLNGTGLYLVDGVPVFICKISSKAAKQPQSLEDLDFAGDSAVAVSHPFGRLHAGQQYLIAAVLNVGKSRLEFSVSDGSLGDVQQYTLFGMPEPANWAGNKTLSVAVQGTVSDGSPGSRGGLSSQPGIWDQTESKNLIGTVTRAAYWNAVLLSIDCRRALSLKTVDADATVSWISESGRNYTLQCREELSSGSWSNVTDSIHGSNETLSRTNLMKHSSEFFRVISERSPLFTDDFSTGTAWSGGYVQNNRLFLETGTTAMLNGVTVTDFELAVDVRPGNAQTQADILFRMNDAEEGYVLRLDTAEQMARWISSGASENELASLPMKLESGQWVSVRMIVRHENFKLFINEQPLPETPWPKFDGVDSTFTEGRVGLRVSGGAARFQSLEIYEPNGPVSGAMYQNPVQVNCADPVVLLHDGLYYAYCTYAKGTNIVEGIGLYTSPDLITWTDRGYALQAPDSWGDGSFWAPDIVERNGTFYLYYAAETRLCVATADSPLGPFTQSVQQPMEPSTLRIDAHVLEDDDGQCYLYYVHFGAGNEIWGAKLNDDMLTVDESTLTRLIVPDQPWEQHQASVTEGPEVIRHKGLYYLTYSGSHYQNINYAVGYVVSDSPLGPFEKYEYNPILKSTAYAHGAGHHCLTTSPDGSELFIVYHRHKTLTTVNPRKLSIDRIRFVEQASGPDVLEVWGPTSSPQPVPSGVE